MVAIPRPLGQDRRRADRRQAIVDAATGLFADRGFSGVSIQEIADTAGTHKTTVLYHFATKDALHEAVLEQALTRIAEIQREFLAGPFIRDRVAYLLDQILAFYAEHTALARLLQRELLEPGGSDAYLRRFVEPIYVPAVQSLRRAAAAGIIREVDPAMFVHDMHVTLVGYFCDRALLDRLAPARDHYALDALIARRDYLVDLIFHTLAPDAPKRSSKSTSKKP